MTRFFVRTAVAGIGLVMGLPAVAAAAVTFTPGNYYATKHDSTEIRQYNAAGAVIGSANAPGETRGIAFGDDGLLYVTILPNAPGTGFTVRALNASMGTVHTFSNPTQYMHGNITYGRLALDANYVYVAGGESLHRFARSNPSAAPVSIYTGNQVHDVEVLPNGNLLVAEAYEVREITTAGTVLREINYGFTDVRTVEYDPGTQQVFVSHFGNTGTTTEMMRFDFTTFALTDESTSMAVDMFVTREGNLLLSSVNFSTTGPRLFNTNLDSLDTFDGDYREFVTQMVPEPTGLALAALASVALLRRNRRGADGPAL